MPYQSNLLLIACLVSKLDQSPTQWGKINSGHQKVELQSVHETNCKALYCGLAFDTARKLAVPSELCVMIVHAQTGRSQKQQERSADKKQLREVVHCQHNILSGGIWHAYEMMFTFVRVIPLTVHSRCLLCSTDLWGIHLALHSKACIALVYALLHIYAESFSWPNAVFLETFDVLLLSDETPIYTGSTGIQYVNAQR